MSLIFYASVLSTLPMRAYHSLTDMNCVRGKSRGRPDRSLARSVERKAGPIHSCRPSRWMMRAPTTQSQSQWTLRPYCRTLPTHMDSPSPWRYFVPGNPRAPTTRRWIRPIPTSAACRYIASSSIPTHGPRYIPNKSMT